MFKYHISILNYCPNLLTSSVYTMVQHTYSTYNMTKSMTYTPLDSDVLKIKPKFVIKKWVKIFSKIFLWVKDLHDIYLFNFHT